MDDNFLTFFLSYLLSFLLFSFALRVLKGSILLEAWRLDTLISTVRLTFIVSKVEPFLTS